jgi:hypothetical protein
MTDVEIDAQNAEIAEAIAQYESHARRDYASLVMAKEQNAILAHLAWEQQVHICDLTERHLQLAEEKEKLVKVEDATILDHMIDMNGLYTSLRESLEKRQQKVSEILSPIYFSKISGTMKKLKSALIDGNVLNTSLVKKNNSLQVELSFIPREMRDRITIIQCEIRGMILIISFQMGTDSFFKERIQAIHTSLNYKHVAFTIPLVTSFKRQITCERYRKREQDALRT